MKLAIIGATGTIGRELVQKGLRDGHHVTALTRSGNWPDGPQENLRVLQGDVFEPKTLLPIVRDQDAVVVTLGGGLWGTNRSQGTANVIEAMETVRTQRLIVLSSMGVGDSEYLLNFKWRRLMFGLLLRAVYLDHFRQERAVRFSSLDWTIVRPSAYDDTLESGGFNVGDLRALKGKLKLAINRADVAGFLLKTAKSADFLRQSPSISH